MDDEKINKIVWWIPFKKLRDAVRNILSELINNENKLRKITPQPYLDFIEFHLAEHCNLGCYSCVQFSQVAEEEYYDIDEFERDVKRLFELTNGLIGRIHFLGGEPLLNKNCKDYFYNKVFNNLI